MANIEISKKLSKLTANDNSKMANKLLVISSLVCILLMIVVAKTLEAKAESSQISIRMPDIRPDHAEQYLCMAHRLPVDSEGQFIVGFNPQSDASRVHHMLMYGCQMPGIMQRDSPNFVWDCSEMHTSNEDNQAKSFESGAICRGSSKILYGWALNAPALKLPDGVGFKVGGLETNIHYLVIQVHYGHFHVFEKLPDLTDNSGLILDLKRNDEDSGITKQAGVLLLISLGNVMPGRTRHEIWCEIKDDIEIHPFRYRVHTHKLGTKVLGAKLGSNSIAGFGDGSKDVIIGSKNPQEPQMFYPVEDKNMTIGKNDQVYAYCEYNNNKSRIVNIGPTGDDEMCNFYLMYWTSSPKLLTRSNCFGHNPRGKSLLSSLLS